jgi:hypothetical protein
LQISGWATRAFNAARERIQDDFPGWGQRGWKLRQNMGKSLENMGRNARMWGSNEGLYLGISSVDFPIFSSLPCLPEGAPSKVDGQRVCLKKSAPNLAPKFKS